MPTTTRSPLIVIALTIYFSLLAIVFCAVLQRTEGHYTAPQDDPYIHLAMAEHMTHGEYGINTGESSSPSSSMVWPFMLAVLAPATLGIYSALIWNVVAGCFAVFLLCGIVDEWPDTVLPTKTRRIIALVTFILLSNLVGLTLLGMEHTLQVALAIACAAGVCRVINGGPMPWWSIAAAAAAPWVRYEDFTLTLAIGVILFFQRRRSAALVMSVSSLVPLVAFSVFLKHLGLPALPVSVLVKSGTAAGHASAIGNALSVIKDGALADIKTPTHWPLLLIFIGLLAISWFEASGIRRIAALAAASATLLHLLLGHFGWWYRYEVYMMIFSTLVLLRLFLERVRPALVWYVVAAMALSSIYLRALWATPGASEAIYGQQYQMHRFATDYYHGTIAVNDLGEVAFRHPNGYVLDLFGLASVEAARQKDKNAAWTGALVEEHHAGLVMIYPGIFGIPATWTKVGDLCLYHTVKGLGGRCVSFYSSRPEGTADLEAKFREFAQTMPKQTTATPVTP